MQSSFFVQSTDLPGYLHEPKLPHQAPATPTLDERPGRDLFCPLQVHQRPVDDRERHGLAHLDELRRVRTLGLSRGTRERPAERSTSSVAQGCAPLRWPHARRCRISMMGRGNDCFSTGRIMVS